MKFGFYISGFAHATLILWLFFGGVFLPTPDEDLLQVSQVSILSVAEFEALSEAEPESAAPITSPAAPARPAQPTPEPEPAPQPEPEPEPAPEPQPEPQPTRPPAPEAQPTNIDRVAPESAPEPDPQTEVAPVETPEVAVNAPGEEAEPVAEETAPEAATNQIVTEATETVDLSELAPTTSARPNARPNRPVPQPDPETPAVPDNETPPQPASDPIADAVAEAIAEAAQTPDQPATTPGGPPLSRGELRALQVSVGNCWNVGSLSSESLRTTVVVGVALTPEGQPEVGSIHLVSYSGGSQGAANKAYETARRAIIRCGASGYNLPADKYEQWREIEMTFNPEDMRIK